MGLINHIKLMKTLFGRRISVKPKEEDNPFTKPMEYDARIYNFKDCITCHHRLIDSSGQPVVENETEGTTLILKCPKCDTVIRYTNYWSDNLL